MDATKDKAELPRTRKPRSWGSAFFGLRLARVEMGAVRNERPSTIPDHCTRTANNFLFVRP